MALVVDAGAGAVFVLAGVGAAVGLAVTGVVVVEGAAEGLEALCF